VRDDGFAAFFREVYPRVVGQLRMLTGDLASAEDVAQEAFVRAAGRWTWAGQGPPVRRLGGGELAVLAPAAR
jgi:DNA-directed RNA polymerase specialized sigma24 family protein